jgi:hypothetical protein
MYVMAQWEAGIFYRHFIATDISPTKKPLPKKWLNMLI